MPQSFVMEKEFANVSFTLTPVYLYSVWPPASSNHTKFRFLLEWLVFVQDASTSLKPQTNALLNYALVIYNY